MKSNVLPFPPPESLRSRQVVDVEVRHASGSLARILGLLARRRCEVVSVDFAAPDRHRPGRLVIAFDAPPAHGHCVVPWLENLVDVVAVRRC